MSYRWASFCAANSCCQTHIIFFLFGLPAHALTHPSGRQSLQRLLLKICPKIGEDPPFFVRMGEVHVHHNGFPPFSALLISLPVFSDAVHHVFYGRHRHVRRRYWSCLRPYRCVRVQVTWFHQVTNVTHCIYTSQGVSRAPHWCIYSLVFFSTSQLAVTRRVSVCLLKHPPY